MTSKFVLSKIAFESLVKQLVDLEDEKNELFEEYFPESSKEHNKIKKLVNDYISQVEHLIQNTDAPETADNCLPFITIGSEVEVQDLSDPQQEIIKFRIVFPLQEKQEKGNVDYVSFFSPVGRSLLLKKVGEKATIQAPGGVFNYLVKSINYPT